MNVRVIIEHGDMRVEVDVEQDTVEVRNMEGRNLNHPELAAVAERLVSQGRTGALAAWTALANRSDS